MKISNYILMKFALTINILISIKICFEIVISIIKNRLFKIEQKIKFLILLIIEQHICLEKVNLSILYYWIFSKLKL